MCSWRVAGRPGSLAAGRWHTLIAVFARFAGEGAEAC